MTTSPCLAAARRALFVAAVACMGGPAFADAPAPVVKRDVPPNCAKPVWPKSSLRNEETGISIINVLIATSGKVIDAVVSKSSGFPDLDDAAMAGIVKCTFKPASEDGKPVQSWAYVQFVWTLE